MRDTGTYTWCGAKIQQDFAILQDAIFLVQLHKLERSSGSVTLLLRKPVPFIQSAFSMLVGVSQLIVE